MRESEIDKEGSFDDSVDRKNTKRMKEIVSTIGWPTITKVGKSASSNAFLLVQHATHDVQFQKDCLSLMMQESRDEVDPANIAYLDDRVRVRDGRPQLYGTQYHFIDGKFVPKDIDDPLNVEERRKEMGLTTIAENAELMYKMYKIKCRMSKVF
jgi:hypothetical protein